MKKNKLKWVLFLTALSITSAIANFKIPTHTINNGASKIMKGDGYEMQASVGQVDAGKTMSDDDGVYKLNSGFWHESIDLIFRNNFEQ